MLNHLHEVNDRFHWTTIKVCWTIWAVSRILVVYLNSLRTSSLSHLIKYNGLELDRKSKMVFEILRWWLLLGASFQLSFIHDCLKEERIALLGFKASLMNPSYDDSLTSWRNSSREENNCCDWDRIVCDNTTRCVINLNLSYVRRDPND